MYRWWIGWHARGDSLMVLGMEELYTLIDKRKSTYRGSIYDCYTNDWL